jgi:hypothetical protein
LGLKISIRTVPIESMRNGQVGDYFLGPDEWLMIQVADLGDWRKELAVAHHEMYEFGMVLEQGIPIQEIDLYDLKYSGEYDEPGMDPKCPYHIPHVKATKSEYEFLKDLNVETAEYENTINNLFKKEEK